MKPLLILCSVLLLNVAGRGEDLYPLRLSPFVKKYLEQPGYAYPLKGGRYSFIDLRPWCDDFKSGGQELIRTDSNLYIFIQSSGRVYKAVKRDSQFIHFKRIDSTLAMFYNIGSYQFSDGEDLYSYGGYGFWKNNGLLRKFNFRQGQWDVVPLDKEIVAQIVPAAFVWFDPFKRKLHIPFQQTVNEGVKQIRHEVGTIDETSWVLDLATRTWEKTGTVHPSVLLTAKNANGRMHYSSTNGLLMESMGQIVWVDYKLNTLGQSGNEPIMQTFFRNIISYDLSFILNDSLFYFNTQDQLADTIFLGNLKPIVENEVIKKDNTITWVSAGFLLTIFTAGMYFRQQNKRKRAAESGSIFERKKASSFVADQSVMAIQEGQEIVVQQDNSAFERDMEGNDSAIVTTIFNATEANLILLCLERSEAGGYADINEINHVLGIKNKNKGLQKKVRSEIFNSVNDKFREHNRGKSGLIESVRNKNDKRYFDYFIESSNFSAIRRMLGLS